MRQGFRITCFVVSLWASTSGSAHADATHPLDALDAEEIRDAVRLLHDAGNIDDTTLFSSIKLAEPPKAIVKSWTPGEPIPRAAQIVARTGGRAFAGVVDLQGGAVKSWTPVAGGQPKISVGEFLKVKKLVASHPEMREHLARRGIDDFENVKGGVNLDHFGGAKVDQLVKG